MGKNCNELYESLYSAWKSAHSVFKFNKIINGSEIQKAMNNYWHENKSDSKTIFAKIKELNAISWERKSKQLTIFQCVVKPRAETITSGELSTDAEPSADPRINVVASATPEQEVIVIDENEHQESRTGNRINDESEESEEESYFGTRRGPAQDKLREDLLKNKNSLCRLNAIKNSGLLTAEDRISLSDVTSKRKRLKQQLKRLQHQAFNSKKLRNKKQRRFEAVKEQFPEAAKALDESLGTRPPGSGRPSLAEEQPLLLKTIVDIVAPESCTDLRRRSDLVRACTTLNDLTRELKIKGFKISRSGTYLHLLPRNRTTTEGKRHVRAVPVKLLRAQKTGRKGHADDHYAFALNKMVRNLAELLGEKVVLAISQDDKARVVMGLPAASKQAPILMRMDYCVRLPDHDWVIATGHKLIPSVYAALTMEKKQLTYSGPTYIAIRSGKHDSSTAASHAHDFRHLIQLNSFKSVALDTGSGLCKPVLLVFTDGGPDENPRYRKVMLEFAKHFRLYDLDCVIVATHAPGQSAYNQVERRMAPLSRDLSGLILPHDSYGSHLDGNGKTIDEELERKNFKEAGITLANVWNETVINGYAVDAEYIEPGQLQHEDTLQWMTQRWIHNHVRQSQYCLQIVKCDDQDCCKPFRSNFNKIIENRFLPAPVKFVDTNRGPQVVSCNEDGYFSDLSQRITYRNVHPDMKTFPLDQYCPSVQNQLQDQTCKSCFQYFVTKAALQAHIKGVHTSTAESIAASIESVIRQFSTEDQENSESEEIAAPEPVNDGIHIINDISSWILSDFVDCED